MFVRHQEPWQQRRQSTSPVLRWILKPRCSQSIHDLVSLLYGTPRSSNSGAFSFRARRSSRTTYHRLPHAQQPGARAQQPGRSAHTVSPQCFPKPRTPRQRRRQSSGALHCPSTTSIEPAPTVTPGSLCPWHLPEGPFSPASDKPAERPPRSSACRPSVSPHSAPVRSRPPPPSPPRRTPATASQS